MVSCRRRTLPLGPDGFEPNPWAPMSEQNEAAVRSVLAEAAERSMRAMTAGGTSRGCVYSHPPHSRFNSSVLLYHSHHS